MVRLEAHGINNYCHFALNFEKEKGELTLDLDEKVKSVFKKVVFKVKTNGVSEKDAKAFITDLGLATPARLFHLIPKNNTSPHLFELHRIVAIENYFLDLKIHLNEMELEDEELISDREYFTHLDPKWEGLSNPTAPLSMLFGMRNIPFIKLR